MNNKAISLDGNGVITNVIVVGSEIPDGYSVIDVEPIMGKTVAECVIASDIAQAEYDSKQYARNRAEAYPSLTDQADMAYWDRQNGTTTLDDAISAVKLQFPKG